MKISKTRNEYIIELFLLLMVIWGYVLKNGMLLGITLLFLTLSVLWKVNNNQILMLESIFFIFYTIPILVHYSTGMQISYYTMNNQEPYIITVVKIQIVFFLIFNSALKKLNFKKFTQNMNLMVYDCMWAYYLCVLGCIFSIVVGRRGSTIFSSGGYGKGVIGSAIFEYCCIFYLLAYYFSGKRKNRLGLLKLVFGFFVVKALLYGARIEILSMGILFFILFFINKLSKKMVLAGVAAVYFALMLFGLFRGNLSFNGFKMGKIFGYFPDLGYMINNEADVFYTSMSMISAIQTGYIDTSYRIGATIHFLVRFLVPGSLTNMTFIPVIYLQSGYAAMGGGGFFSVFWYFYFGWIGVITGGLLCGKLWNIIGKIQFNTAGKQIFAIISVAMVPRWFAYTPESIIKMPLYTLLGYICLRILTKKQFQFQAKLLT